jgi:DNA-binding PadR family transcriptional regulator
MARKPNGSAQTRDLLAAMLRQPHTWQYGYELSKQTGLKSGTLYPLLMRLSDQGLLESKWQEPERPGKPPRHAYKLTSDGLAFARSVKASSTSFAARGKLAGAAT